MKEEKFGEIWSKGYFIIDTCALDYISRCEFEYAKRIMDILLFCEKRILIPQQVAKEMQLYFDKKKYQEGIRNIICSLTNELEAIYAEETSEKQKRHKVISRVSKKIELLKKYAFGVYASGLDKLKVQYTRQTGVYFPDLNPFKRQAEKEVDDISRNETVNSFLQMITEKTLPAFSEAERIQLSKDIKERTAQQLPPGGGDRGKKSNSNGDIIIWNEIVKCIKDKEKVQYLFITNDEKKNNNWFGDNLEQLHPELRKEIRNHFYYDALDITTLYGFLSFCKPYVDEDIDKICEYLIDHNNLIRSELEEYFQKDGQEWLNEQISEDIRDKYMADSAILDTLDIEISSLEYESDLINECIIISLEFDFNGESDAYYHCCSEDVAFPSEFEGNGMAEVYIPVQSGKYTQAFSLEYKHMQIRKIDYFVNTLDPLNRDVEDDWDNESELEDYEEEQYESCGEEWLD